MAAFTPKNSGDKAAYLAKYGRHVSDPTITMRTIWIDGEIVGSLAKFLMEGEAGITYWIDRKWWGQGIATDALRLFLETETTRPIYGRVAFDNYGSQRVLTNCGFTLIGEDTGFANARQAEILELVFRRVD